MFGINIPTAVSKLSKDYDGYIAISDIDKTYLLTQIDTLGGLIRAALEGPERKTSVPGFPILLRAFRRGAAAERLKRPIFFVSASPPQMRQKLLAKMEIDGVEHEGIILKDQLHHVRKADFKKLTEQIGYKLPALLTLWTKLPKNSKLLLFGDDSESDATIFSLFSEVMAKNISPRNLQMLLLFLGVGREESLRVAWAARAIKDKSYPVKAVFINLISGTQPDYYKKLGNSFFATSNSLQAALVLWEKDLIRARALKSIAKDLVINHEIDPEDLLESLEEGARLSFYGRDTFRAIWPYLAQSGWLPPAPEEIDESIEPVPPVVSVWDEGRNKKIPLAELKYRYTDETKY